MNYIQNDKKPLTTPGTGRIITNAIPIFDDNRILQFLKTYAPSLLEYTASMGMRGTIAEIPMTCGYTMCAGVRKMMEVFFTDQYEKFWETFTKLANNYQIFTYQYFAPILSYIREQNNGIMSYYIPNNGFTNMIGPLITTYKSKDQSKLSFMPDILRALYSYETWQAVRCQYENNEKSVLNDLLRFAFEDDKPPFCEAYPDGKLLKHYIKTNVNNSRLKKKTNKCFPIKYINLIPVLLTAVAYEDINIFKNVTFMKDKYIQKQLEIDYDLETFICYNIIQALIYSDESSRIDFQQQLMKIPDLKNESQGEEMIREYIRRELMNRTVPMPVPLPVFEPEPEPEPESESESEPEPEPEPKPECEPESKPEPLTFAEFRKFLLYYSLFLMLIKLLMLNSSSVMTVVIDWTTFLVIVWHFLEGNLTPTLNNN